jgi:hypothetical protein
LEIVWAPLLPAPGQRLAFFVQEWVIFAKTSAALEPGRSGPLFRDLLP